MLSSSWGWLVSTAVQWLRGVVWCGVVMAGVWRGSWLLVHPSGAKLPDWKKVNNRAGLDNKATRCRSFTILVPVARGCLPWPLSISAQTNSGLPLHYGFHL